MKLQANVNRLSPYLFLAPAALVLVFALALSNRLYRSRQLLRLAHGRPLRPSQLGWLGQLHMAV